MADEPKKGKPSTRALAGAMQGIREDALTSAAGLGLLPLMPYIRQRAFATKDLPSKFQTRNVQELESLTKRILEAAENPQYQKRRPIVLQPMARPGHAEFLREIGKKKGQTGALRDILRLGLGAAPESVAHEAGHSVVGGKAGRLIRELGMRARSPLMAAAPTALALSGALSKETPTHAKAAPYLGGAALAAMLAEEGRANIQGAKALQSIGYKMPLAKRLKMFLPTATYLGRAGLLVGMPVGVLKGLEYYNKLQQEGRPMAAKDLLSASPQMLAELPSQEELQAKWKSKLGKST